MRSRRLIPTTLAQAPVLGGLFVLAACGGRASGPAAGSGGIGASGLMTGSTGVLTNSSGGSMTGSTSTSGAVEAGGPDAALCVISASNYDQPCAADSDCVGVAAGNYCGSNPKCNCGGFSDAISVKSIDQFNADLAKTTSGPQITCPCLMPTEPPTTTSACCKNGTCGVCTTALQAVCTPMAVRCVGNGVDTCAPNGEWQGAVVGCGSGTTCVNGACVPVDAGVETGIDSGSAGGEPPSCAPGGPGMTNCGTASESCCTSLPVAGGTYYRTYTNSGTGPTGEADPATVSSFQLDKYLVTVGRFRQFVNAVSPPDGGAGWVPPAGSGKHTYLNGGNGLNATGGGYEPGWVATDDGNAAPMRINLDCSVLATWTNSAGTQENLPINCVNWWESYAFCIWDGGFLPSEAKWEYAAAGGSQQREYPWGSTAPGTGRQYAIYNTNSVAPVGTATLGAGLWGQLDMAGEVWEWNLDWYAPYAVCTDSADVIVSFRVRVLRGGEFAYNASTLLASYRGNADTQAHRFYDIGFRCSRNP